MYLIEKLKGIIKIYIRSQKINVTKNEKKCYIMMAADYGNIGDIAITIAQHKFLQETLKDYKIVEIPLDKIYTTARSIKKSLNSNDIITIIGGGNSGDLYPAFEITRRFICDYFKSYNIISFPQTIDFSSTDVGKKELKKSQKVYHKSKIVFFAREEKSYLYYKEKFENDVYLVPDIVLSLKLKQNQKREGIVLCMRNDKERSTDDILQEKIIKHIKSIKESVKYQDTHIGDKLVLDKETEFKKIIDIFRNSKLVITDRLHGMIFCAITGTPCIAFNNKNKKVEYTYKKWLINNHSIIFLDSFKEKDVNAAIDKLLKAKEYIIMTSDLKKYYQPLKNVLIKRGDGNGK